MHYEIKKNPVPSADDYGTTVFSNAVRLKGRDWLIVAVCAAFLFFLPMLWQHLEPFPLETDYRIPHDLGNDYWLYERYARLAAERYETLLLGDSVIWGEYVLGPETLSHYLNELAGRERFGNLGLDGAHPLALSGLVEHYAGSVAGKNVVLQCNPLWLSSLRADLQDDKATGEINHPRLIPQFVPHVPSYKEEISPRIGVVVEQHLPLSRWTAHLQQVYYDRSDIPSWTLEHPYENPIRIWPPHLPPPDRTLRHLAQPWYESGITPQDYPWVEPEKSLQWGAFRRVVETLQQRGNHLFVLVGPFNEHLLKPESCRRYHEVKSAILDWLRARQIPHVAPPPLPRDQYGDASHPLGAGYAMLARQLWEEPFFTAASR